MKYLLLVRHSENFRSEPIPQELMDAVGKFVEEGFKSGLLIDTAGLKPTSEGHRVTLNGGKLTVTDGPFTETKEMIGGYALVNVKSKEEALDVARKFMELHREHWPDFQCVCEVRALEEN